MNDQVLVQSLNMLVQQSCLFSAGVLLVALLRSVALRWAGARAAYLSWLLLPLLIVSSCLPAFQVASRPLPELVQQLAGLASALPVQPLLAPNVEPFAVMPVALLALWMAGSVALLAEMLRQQLRHARSLRRVGQGWCSPAGSSPAMVGLLPARLSLPSDFEERFNAEERRLVLAHENVHANRFDNACNLLAALLLALQWFNPLAWWAHARMRADQELACDAVVLEGANADALASYAQALLKSHQSAGEAILASGWALRHPLLERVRLLRRHGQSPWRRQLGQALVLLGAASFTLLVHAVSAPAVSIEPPGDEPRVQLELSYLQGTGSWTHKKMYLDIATLSAKYGSIVFNLPIGDWCMGVKLYHFPDNTVRPRVQLLRADCSAALSEELELGMRGQLSSFHANTESGGLQVQLAARYNRAAQNSVDASQANSNLRQEMSEAALRMREELDQLRAQDAAWRASRGEPKPAQP